MQADHLAGDVILFAPGATPQAPCVSFPVQALLNALRALPIRLPLAFQLNQVAPVN